MQLNQIKWQSFKDYITKTNPKLERQEALYRLTFENGKQYIGQTTDILKRIEEHLFFIQGHYNHKCDTKWYSDARVDNGLENKHYYELLKMIKIEIYPCNNSHELEQEVLYEERESGHQSLYYNSQFYKPRKWAIKEKEGNRSAVIF